MKRPDYLPQLARELSARKALPFRWGGTYDAQDCCTFAAACIDAMTGSQRLIELSQCYSDRRSALQYIRRFGSLAKTLAHHLGSEKSEDDIETGDIVIAHQCGVSVVGIILGTTIVAPARDGLVWTDRLAAVESVWAV